MKKLFGFVFALCAVLGLFAGQGPAAFAADNPTGSAPDCPITLRCRFVPAAHAAPDPSKPQSYGNYDPAHRPKDMKINSIVVHDTEGSYDATIKTFQDPKSAASANYIIQPNGDITEAIRPQDISWGAANWSVNAHTINIEHVGMANDPNSYTDAMYNASAALVRYLSQRYGIKMDRAHVLGHDEVPTEKSAQLKTAHWDPGPYWDWNRYMNLICGCSAYGNQTTSAQSLVAGKIVAIDPDYGSNRPQISQCTTAFQGCTPLPPHGSNVVRLHQEPSESSPLISEPHVHADGSAGTDAIQDWSSTTTAGQKFVVADVRSNWVSVWFGGSIGWINDSDHSLHAVEDGTVDKVTPLSDRKSVPVYGASFPEPSAFPSNVAVRTADALYEMPSNQTYALSGKAKSDYIAETTVDLSASGDGTVVKGKDTYFRVWFNHRVGYVKSTDVKLN